MAFCDYCICFVEEAANRILAEKLISEVSTYTLPKKVHSLAEGEQYKNGLLLPLIDKVPLTEAQLSILSNCYWLLVVCNNKDQNALGISQAINYFTVRS